MPRHAVHAHAAQPAPARPDQQHRHQQGRGAAGVVAVLHRGNLPAEYRDVKLGAGPPDRFLFNEEVFEVGAPVAVVAAESEHIADEAMRLIEVQYEVLPAVLDIMEGMKARTPKQWDNKLDGTDHRRHAAARARRAGHRTRATSRSRPSLTSGTEQHLALEPTNSVMYWDNDKLVVYYTNQYAHGSRTRSVPGAQDPAEQGARHPARLHGLGLRLPRAASTWPRSTRAILAKMTGRPVQDDLHARRGLRHRAPTDPQFRNEMKMRRQPRRHASVRPVQGHRQRRRAARRRRRTAPGSTCSTCTRSRT